MRDGDLEARARTHDSSRWWTGTTSSSSELQLQLDPSQSVIGRAMKMWGSKK